jgi:biotin transport system substrate-specific component
MLFAKEGRGWSALLRGGLQISIRAFSVREMAVAALFTAVLCVAAPFSIAIGAIPLSFATLVIYLTAGALGLKFGVLSVALYIALGAVGLPVFANFEGGFQKVAGLTGGFILGYIPLALAAGLAAEFSEKKRWLSAVCLVIGTVLLYTFGTLWFILQTGVTPGAALLTCVVPFLPGDTFKVILAHITAPKLRAALKRGQSHGA